MPYDLYPAVDQNYDFAQEVRLALSKSMELRSLVVPMTTVLRNNLTAAEKWDGRVIVNIDTDRLERYDAGLTQWVSIPETSDADNKYVLKTQDKGVRNVVRNGDMWIAQRGDGPYPASTIGMDGWLSGQSGGTVSTSRIGQGAGGSPFLTMAISGQSAAGDLALVTQRIENVGTLNGQTVTISLLAKAASGTPKIAFEFVQYFGTGGSPSATVWTRPGAITISTVLTRYSFTFFLPSAQGMTTGTNRNDRLDFSIWLSAGSSAAANASNIGIQNNTFYITDIQLEEGSVATPFERLPIQKQLSWCQRYFQRFTVDSNLAPIGVGTHYGNVQSAYIIIHLPVRMRTIPTIVTTGASGAGGFYLLSHGVSGPCTSLDPQGVGQQIVEVLAVTASPIGQIGDAAWLRCQAANAFLDMSAEL